MNFSALLEKLEPLLWLMVFVALLGFGVAGTNKRRDREKPSARRPLSDREQAMFFRLRNAFPEHIVLAQVALSALLDAKTQSTRNTFNQKVADFALCTKGFDVVAVIELDDSSHRAKQAKDAQRDAMLKEAGLRPLRFKNVPDIEALRKAVNDVQATSVA